MGDIKWISVKDALPAYGERVLITEGTCVFEAYRSISNKWVRSGIGWAEDVTHWAQMPEPSKEDAHGPETGEKVDGWTYRYIAQLEANQIKGRCKDCKYVIRDTCHGKISDDFVCGDGWTKADGYCDEWEPKEDAHGPETGEKHEAQEMADEGPGEAGTEPV